MKPLKQHPLQGEVEESTPASSGEVTPQSFEILSFPATQDDDVSLERESRKLKRALVHATVFLTRGPFLIREAREALDCGDHQRLRTHARTLRLCAWQVSRGGMVTKMTQLDAAAEEGDLEHCRAILDDIGPEFDLLVSRISILLSS